MTTISSSVVAAVIKAASSEYRIVDGYRRVPLYNDEPRLYQYVARLAKPAGALACEADFAYGTSLDRDDALVKAVSEAIERHALYSIEDSKIAKREVDALDTAAARFSNLSYFNAAQQEFYVGRVKRRRGILNWFCAEDVLTSVPAWIPAQLVYLAEMPHDEAIIKIPDSTGAACGTSKVAAVCRGILEVLERDAYILWYLTKKKATVVDLRKSTDGRLVELLRLYERYRLKLVVLKLPSLTSFPVILVAILDETGVGPAVTVGLKAHFDPIEAIVGAIAEAQQSRPWLRDILHSANGRKNNVSKIKSLQDRALYWADTRRIAAFNKLWSSEKHLSVDALFSGYRSPTTWSQVRGVLIDACRRAGFSVYCADVTTALVRELGFRVVKIIIPEAQPVYFDEQLPYLGGNRLREALSECGPRWGSLLRNGNFENLLPHPFI